MMAVRLKYQRQDNDSRETKETEATVQSMDFVVVYRDSRCGYDISFPDECKSVWHI